MLSSVVYGHVNPGEPFEVKPLVSVGGCYIVHVDFKVQQISLNLKMAPNWNPRWHTVRMEAEGTVEEREHQIRRILGLNNDDVLPVSNFGGFNVVVYCCGMYPKIDEDLRTAVGMVDVGVIMVVEAPDTIDSHRDYLRELGFVRHSQVDCQPSGYVWLLDKVPFLNMDMNMIGDEELNVTISSRGYGRRIAYVFGKRATR